MYGTTVSDMIQLENMLMYRIALLTFRLLMLKYIRDVNKK